MNFIPILAASGEGLLKNLFVLLVIVTCGAILYFLGKLVGKMFEAPEVFFKGWLLVFAFVGAIALINFLLSLIGHGFITF